MESAALQNLVPERRHRGAGRSPPGRHVGSRPVPRSTSAAGRQSPPHSRPAGAGGETSRPVARCAGVTTIGARHRSCRFAGQVRCGGRSGWPGFAWSVIQVRGSPHPNLPPEREGAIPGHRRLLLLPSLVKERYRGIGGCSFPLWGKGDTGASAVAPSPFGEGGDGVQRRISCAPACPSTASPKSAPASWGARSGRRTPCAPAPSGTARPPACPRPRRRRRPRLRSGWQCGSRAR